MKEQFEMVKVESRYSEGWIVYPAGGNYIYDKIAELPGGSKVADEAAQKVLDIMNQKIANVR